MTGKQLKNSILQWAIQGRLVPQNPDDEPAAKLLERIRHEKERLIKEKKIKRDKNATTIYRDGNSFYEKNSATGKAVCIDDEIPFQIPEGWEWCRVRDISSSYIGLTYKPSDVSERGTIVLRSSNIQNGKLVLDDIVKVSCDINEKLFVENNDILICARNGSAKLVGKSAIINSLEEPMTFGAFMAICKTEFYKYVYQFLQSDLFFSQLRGVSGTTTINQLTQNDFNNFLLPLPPLPEQERIVSKIEELMPLVERYGAKNDELQKLNATISQKLRKSILQEAIQGRLVPQNEDDEPAAKLLERIRHEKERLIKEKKIKRDKNATLIYRDGNSFYEKNSATGKAVCIDNEIPFQIPEGWEWVRLGEIVDTTIGKTPARGEQKYWADGVYNWISISDMSDGGVIYSTKEKLSDYASNVMPKISPKGSLIMSFKLTVGRTSILGIDAYHNEAIITIRPFVDDNHKMRNYLLKALPLLSIYGDSKDAIKGKTLNSKSIANLLLPLPPLPEQERIVSKIEEAFSRLR